MRQQKERRGYRAVGGRSRGSAVSSTLNGAVPRGYLGQTVPKGLILEWDDGETDSTLHQPTVRSAMNSLAIWISIMG